MKKLPKFKVLSLIAPALVRKNQLVQPVPLQIGIHRDLMACLSEKRDDVMSKLHSVVSLKI